MLLNKETKPNLKPCNYVKIICIKEKILEAVIFANDYC